MIYYKIDIISEMKKRGYNSNKIRKSKLMGEGTLQNIREGKPISTSTLNTICKILRLQPGDIIGFKDDIFEQSIEFE